MNPQIELNNNIWVRTGDTYVRGHVFYEGDYVDSSDLGRIVNNTTGVEEISKLLDEFIGFYGIVIDRDEQTILVADRMRTGPLFYSQENGDLLVSDDCSWIIDQIPKTTWSEISRIEYKTSRFVTGSHTLYKEINQIQSGEIVVFDKSKNEFSFYQHHVHTVTKPEYGYEELAKEFDRVLKSVFNRIVEIANDRPIVLPLSGGYDSRLIALMLKRVGYENVITYTINTGGKNTDIAKRIAENLGFPWYSAKLTHSDWQEFYESDVWNNYFNRAAYIGSLPHPTNVPPIRRLKESGILPENALFLPGHSSLDSMKATPVAFENQDEINLDQLTNAIIDQHFKYNEHLSIPFEDVRDRVAETLGLTEDRTPSSLMEAFERWRLKERRAKLIVNGVRAIEFSKYQWWMPLEDKELYEFWRQVPIEKKRHRSFYEKYIKQLYVEIAGVSLREAGHVADNDLKANISNMIRGLPIESAVRQLYSLWDESIFRYIYTKYFQLGKMYESDPRYGITTKEKLKNNYNGQSFLFFSLLALSVTGDIEL
ncbi:asparagine synthase-related protein [Halalkalirubrum salinum]|uniref:asparagine synthase-related protein n=1 Tax=Halalkalirubrum salinum TaxID=2563889 RepID=UPI0010FB4F1C|nr:asparagine synthetase B family protein [Halalkalirubrum salinum]